MENILNNLKERCKTDWLVGYDSHQFYNFVQEYSQQFNALSRKVEFPRILLVELNNYKFLAAFLAAVINHFPIFLGNPHWKRQEWEQVLKIVEPDLILGIELPCQNAKKVRSNPFNDCIMIPTGGSSGKIRFAIHTWDTLTASAKGFFEYFEVNSVNSFCVLPLYHVSGLMQFVRSFLSGGKLALVEYKQLKENKVNLTNINDYFISLVPTQMQYLLNLDAACLSQFKTVLLGGAPPWQSLLDTARKHKINLALTYGMTETASQVVTLKPEDFLIGNNSTGQVLPHAKVTIRDEVGNPLSVNEIGTITIEAKSLLWGYYANSLQKKELITDDLGYCDTQGYLYIIGRSSQKIITGGENVFPAEIEAAILTTNLVKDVAVVGVSDMQWGQLVTAVYVPQNTAISSEDIKAAIAPQLSYYKIPKQWIAVESLPRNQLGKLNYKQVYAALKKLGY